ncbi:DUF4445 domain-containing protein [Aminipila butyrica]|uniref:DUF4445 domain-containing protein n=1 Tax=Aminipila butyrica TaxID=433296 RepID=A0A858BZ55_9FIRM|nr:ASKHA domain-containing protein [Aminipila butyrica]QIB69994.1 DUF4445 domain-containing protein [Aminipila butyrica]
MNITFLPQNRTIQGQPGETVLQAAARAGIHIDGNCAGAGTCGKCLVKISGRAEQEAGYRLACTELVWDGMIVQVPELETADDRKKKLIRLPENFVPQPTVRKQLVRLTKTGLAESQSLQERIQNALGQSELVFPCQVLRVLPTLLKESQELTLTLWGSQVLHAEAGDQQWKNYGVAVDMGTTTVVIMLWDLNKGQLVQVAAKTNPQSVYGADVISRITGVMEDGQNLQKLQGLMIQCINEAVSSFEETEGVQAENIYRYSLVGNTTMSHILLGIDPCPLAVSPFEPVFTRGVEVRALELGLKGNTNAGVHLAPNIAGHVGSDITAGILTTSLLDWQQGHLFLDIGTNGEIVLAGKGRAAACSTAAGPAFEGSSIRQGMRAALGAIEQVEIEEEQVRIQTIGGGEPLGICGSGIIDAVGELIRTGLLDKSGRLLSKEKLRQKGISEPLLEHVREEGRSSQFVLYFSPDGFRDVVLTQKDLREVQLVKAAISAGMTILMKELGLELRELERITIAGAFGSYIRRESAVNMGLLPNVEEDKFFFAGNTAGIGAAMILLSADCQKAAEALARQIQHVELAARSDFQEYYMAAMGF